MGKILALICCLVFTACSAQIVVKGTIIDDLSGLPVDEALVYLDIDIPPQYTSPAGKFEFRISSAPKWVIIQHVNYQAMVKVNPESLGNLTIRLTPTSHRLGQAVSVAFEGKQELLESPTPIGIVNATQLQSGDESSIAQAINLIPGVKMEQRGNGGSRRINIRGSFLRSPFAVRNIKMYWEGIPLTSADGSSPLELIDNADIGAIEVIKGPAGSAYGAGNGGVLLFRGKRVPFTTSGISAQSSLTAGS
ncbi:MAG: TonB-dependent receptor plug domain-containing protein, partial [Flavobacteriales bacterium]|nr:TonB-dependent receptor plug domain-containing protein [Flavobacteriales bacterium]